MPQKHPLLQTLISLPQEPLEEDRLSPAAIDQLIGEILKSFEDPEVTKDPLMSPALAPDEMLIGLPIIHLVVRGRRMVGSGKQGDDRELEGKGGERG